MCDPSLFVLEVSLISKYSLFYFSALEKLGMRLKV